MSPGRIFAISCSALLLGLPAAATGKPISEAHRIRHQCIDRCRSVATVCTTKCGSEDCLEACTEPLDACIDKCRAKYPRETR
ncbi:MAG: hypothetical protein WAK01_17890 [Methylocystis sp.]